MNFKNWVKSIQTAGYNGARTVHTFEKLQSKKIKVSSPETSVADY